jgi:putative ABC transport system permease protein
VNANTRLAWRNLWRNRRRTWLTVGAMIFSNVLLVFLISLQLGSYKVMIENTLSTLTGHLQVQQVGYLDNPRMRTSIEDVAVRATALRDTLGVSTVAARATAFALASSEDRSFGIQIMGVQPEFEPLVSTLPGLVKQGSWFSSNTAEEIVLGAVLARNLQVSLGDEITFMGSGRDGSFAAGIARVVGILESGMPAVDRSMAQLPLAYFDSVFAMEGQGHMIVVNVPLMALVEDFQNRIISTLADNTELVVLDWDALVPGLRQAIKADMASAWFIYAILIVLVAFSVLNTQLMSVLERTREFGTMLALGIRPGRLGRLVALETFFMAALGLGIGVFLGYLVALYLSFVGFTMPGMEEMAQKFNMPDRMYPEMSFLSIFWGPAVVFLGAMLAAIYPATRLLRLQPVIAMRSV